MKVNIVWVKSKDLGDIGIMTVKYTKENGRMVNRMGRAN